ncbi:TIR domain-containing protein [Planococcus halocryophilus]|uniref:TIR domain-containing protein n=1 Tax=Planococcus halocryophilus TaxID=1215089 RepID=UPI001F0DC0C7|nr:TIR domain-containing protein [Planococcus halocryophilus]MCH4828060.1 toll/interleukin-1 receptor domain-containing protein [Planococcus halocryophilus]
MALFTERELKGRGSVEAAKGYYQRSASAILRDNYKNFSHTKTYDVFLSHSFLDAEVILGLKSALEEKNYTVYVDWIEDKQLSRNNVNSETANQLRMRMKNCSSLFFATSDNSSNSKWMPWELGYFDGLKNKVAIIPIKKSSFDSNNFSGQEYLGLYDYVIEQYGSLHIQYLNGKTKRLQEWIKE